MSAANESDSGSSDGLHCSGVTDTPADDLNVQGMPDILAQLRARAMREIEHAERWKTMHKDVENTTAVWCEDGVIEACTKFLQWLDELGACQTNNTAPDTTSGSAGIP